MLAVFRKRLDKHSSWIELGFYLDLFPSDSFPSEEQSLRDQPLGPLKVRPRVALYLTELHMIAPCGSFVIPASVQLR